MNELNEFSLDTENGEKNYNLAIWYENQGHTAPAHSYYLRASERSEDKLLRYKSLIRASFCYKKQGSRDFTERTLLENALMLMPERPEAYYFLSAIYEKQQDWQQCYIYASLGLECYKNNLPSLNIQEYCGKELLIFEKAVSSWTWGRGKETRNLFELLYNQYYHNMDDRQKSIIDENVNKFGLNKKQKRIFDCFRFFNEKELLELRYHILKDHVDKFIILQGTKTQSGNSCELLAEKYIDELELPKEKFIVVNVDLPGNDEDIESKEEDILFRQLSGQSSDSYQNSLNARTRERILLDSLLSIISEFTDKDVFLVSDCDEIIKPEYIDWFSNMALQHPECLIKVPLIELHGKANLRAYYKNTNQPVCTDNVFFICTKQHLEKCTPFKMRFNILNPFQIVYITQDGKRVEECGWHFSWMGDTNRLKLKQKSTSHYADQIHSAVIQDMSSKDLETYIDEWSPQNNGTYVWGNTDTVLKEYEIEKLPKQILNFSHLKQFFVAKNNSNLIIDTANYLDINGFEKLAGTDKFTTHSYDEVYEELFKEYKNKNGVLLEIGIFKGGSLLLWSEILKNYQIVGIDISNCINDTVKADLDTKSNIFFTNAYTNETINELKTLYPSGFDIIIDDGPHTEKSQIDAINLYLPLLKNKGILVIEDVQDINSISIFEEAVNKFDDSNYEIKTYDLRDKKGRYDDIVFCVKKNNLISSIPVLGVPIVNGVHWLKRLIDSIDYPIDELFIVNNNGRDQITEELNSLLNIKHNFINKIRVCHLPSNIGVSGAWNLIIKSYLMSPYWIICNNDVAFTPGFLKEMVEKSNDKTVGIIQPYGHNGLGSYECFLIKDFVIQECGLFDENYYPAYVEDVDYILLSKQNNIIKHTIISSFYHGETLEYSKSGSQTTRLEPELKSKMHDVHMLNKHIYFPKKWGSECENIMHSDTIKNKNNTLKYDLEFNRKKYLGF